MDFTLRESAAEISTHDLFILIKSSNRRSSSAVHWLPRCPAMSLPCLPYCFLHDGITTSRSGSRQAVDSPTWLAGLLCWRYRYVHQNISMIARRRQSLLLMKSKASLQRGGRSSARFHSSGYGNDTVREAEIPAGAPSRSARGRGGCLRREGYHRRDTGTNSPRRVRPVQPAPFRIGPEGIGNPDDGFGSAQRQYAIGFDHPC
jgi:hypothetical protein